MRDLGFREPVELTVAAESGMMLVIRLTTAGVTTRAGLTIDAMDNLKIAAEEACSCLIGEAGGPDRLRLRFIGEDGALKIRICGDGACGGAPIGEDECTVVRCILESLVDGVDIRMHGDAVGAVELRVGLSG